MKEYIYERVKNTINNIKEIKDIYVLSLFIYDEEDDPRNKTITLGFNTNKQYKKSIKEAFDELDAKWNYCYYLQNKELVIGLVDHEKALITDWIKGHNLYFSDQKFSENRQKALIIGEEITKQFYKVLIEIVKRLHQDGVVRGKFGKDIPIIIHGLDYNDDVMEINKQANPKEVIKEFVEWIEVY